MSTPTWSEEARLGVRGGSRRVGRVLGSSVAATLDTKLAVGVGLRLAVLVEAAFLYVLLGIVLLDPGEERLGITGDGCAELGLLGGRELVAQERDGGLEQELERVIGQGAQHA
jgi:hypothetical protein